MAIAGSEAIIDQMSSRQYGSEIWTIDNMVAALEQAIAFADRLKIDTSVMKPIRDLYAKASKLGFGSRDVAALYEAIIPRS